MRVRKYNKKLEDFENSKIVNSIKLASAATESENVPEFMANRIADQIEEELTKKNTNIVEAEKISDMVENRLMQTAYKEVAKSYITYHYDRQKEHVYQSDIIKAFEKKLNGSNIENSNANCDERSFSGRMNEAARVLLKDNALKNMSKTARDNHNNNEVYTHDLDSYSSGMHNCLSIPIDNMNKDGVLLNQLVLLNSSLQFICRFSHFNSLVELLILTLIGQLYLVLDGHSSNILEMVRSISRVKIGKCRRIVQKFQLMTIKMIHAISMPMI